MHQLWGFIIQQQSQRCELNILFHLCPCSKRSFCRGRDPLNAVHHTCLQVWTKSLPLFLFFFMFWRRLVFKREWWLGNITAPKCHLSRTFAIEPRSNVTPVVNKPYRNNLHTNTEWNLSCVETRAGMLHMYCLCNSNGATALTCIF